MEDSKFSWVPTHKSIVSYLKTKENSQEELISVLKSVGSGPFYDKLQNLDENCPFSAGPSVRITQD